jgi:hypothetical protein
VAINRHPFTSLPEHVEPPQAARPTGNSTKHPQPSERLVRVAADWRPPETAPGYSGSVDSDHALVTAVRHTAPAPKRATRGRQKKKAFRGPLRATRRTHQSPQRHWTSARPRPSPARRTSSLSRSERASSAEPTRTTRSHGSDRAHDRTDTRDSTVPPISGPTEPAAHG